MNLNKESIKENQSFSNLNITISHLKQEIPEQSYLKSLELNPKDKKSYLNLGNFLVQQDRHNEAEVYYLKAIDIYSNYSDAYYNLGKLYIIQKKIKEAEENYLKSIKAIEVD